MKLTQQIIQHRQVPLLHPDDVVDMPSLLHNPFSVYQRIFGILGLHQISPDILFQTHQMSSGPSFLYRYPVLFCFYCQSGTCDMGFYGCMQGISGLKP